MAFGGAAVAFNCELSPLSPVVYYSDGSRREDNTIRYYAQRNISNGVGNIYFPYENDRRHGSPFKNREGVIRR